MILKAVITGKRNTMHLFHLYCI